MGEKVYPARMHSLEHILNGTMNRMFGCGRAFSSHVESKKSKCDYRFDRDLTPDEVAELTRRINETVARCLPITEEIMPRELVAEKFSLARLPEDAGNTLRIVHVGDYDSCPCIGEHASNTSELDPIRIVSTDHADGVLRVRFKFDRP